jgi:hypothetical protein
VGIAIALSLIPTALLYGPQAALIAESFGPRLRYSGAGIGYHLASVIAGGPAPFIAAARAVSRLARQHIAHGALGESGYIHGASRVDVWARDSSRRAVYMLGPTMVISCRMR